MMKEYGFTLIEMMIVVAVIGILAAIGYPSYQNSVRKTKRGEMKTELSRLAQEIEAQKSIYKRYDRIPLEKIGFSNTGVRYFPSSVEKNYELIISNENGNIANEWIIDATPDSRSSQKNTGNVKINSQRQVCWDGDGDCNLSATSTWKD